jgi:uncharacterized protein (TIGR03435 family)
MAWDDFVMVKTGSAGRCVRSLARFHDLRRSAAACLLAAGLLGKQSSLGDRIESLLRRGRKVSARPSQAGQGVNAMLVGVLLGVGGLIPNWIAIAQTVVAWPQSFEVASVKPAKPGGRGFGLRGTWGKLWATGTLDELITYAYQIEPKQLDGVPSWARNRRYTVEAEAPPELATDIAIARKLPPDQRKQASLAERRSELQMVRSLLADRFKLRVHEQIKRLPVYELVLAKGGSKLKPENAADFIAAHRKPNGNYLDGGSGYMTALGLPMSGLALALSRRLQRTVIDRTGLRGRYDFTLKWDASTLRLNAMNSSVGQPLPADNEPSGPSIFTAIRQQLGLKLKAAKGPVEVLVVDRVEPPTPN